MAMDYLFWGEILHHLFCNHKGKDGGRVKVFFSAAGQSLSVIAERIGCLQIAKLFHDCAVDGLDPLHHVGREFLFSFA